MASRPSVALRLGMDGESEIKAGFDRIAESGTASAKRLQGEFERAGEDIEAAFQRRQAAIQKMMAVSATPIQRQIDSSVGSGSSGASQNATAAEWNRLLAEQERTANAVRAAIDPLWAAEQRYADEIARLDVLLANGTLQEDLHAKAVLAAGRTYDETKTRLTAMGGGFERSSVQAMMLRSAASNTASSLASGMPIFRIFAEQGIEVAAAMGAGNAGREGATGAMAKFAAFMGGPWGLAVQVGVGLLAVFIPKLLETGTAAGAAEKQLKAFSDRQADMGRFIDANTGKLREQNRQLALIAKMQLPAQISAQAGTTQGYVNQGFATARNALSSTTSGDLLARAQLNRAIEAAGSNVQVLNRNIAALAQHHPEFAALSNEVAGFAGQAAEAALQIHTLQGRQTDLNTLLSGGTVVTSAMIDRQVTLATATDGVARAQAKLSDIKERGAAIDAMDAGPAKTKELEEYRQQLTAATNAVSAAQAAKKAAAKSDAADAAQAKKDAAELATLLEHMNRLNIKPLSLKDLGIGDFDKDPLWKGLEDAQTERLAVSAYAVQQAAAQQKTLQFSSVELATIGMTADRRQMILDRLTAANDLEEHGVDLASDAAQNILDGVTAQDKMNVALRKAGESMEELRSAGSQVIDDVLNPQNWNSWASLGKTVLRDLEMEFLKLAAINPLKNLLGGSSLPTLSSALGSIGKLFGGSGAGVISSFNASTPMAYSSLGAIGSNAGGTEYWGGGRTWVAENGPEIINLPRGASVTPAPQTRRILNGANNNQPVVVHLAVAAGEMFQATVSSISDGRVALAAPTIAQGGASLAQSQLGKRRRRQMR